MAAAGARGETLAEMSHVLHVDSLADAHGAFADLLASLPTEEPRAALVDPRNRDLDPAQIHIADRVWADKRFVCRDDFLTLLRDRYRVSLGQADMAGASEAARAEINAWVGKQTQERIPDLLPPDSIDSSTMLVLVNAVYFKALWSRPFAAARTRDEDFATPKGTVKARMMRQMDYSQAVQYARIDNLQLVELPYVGQVSMIVFLPDDSDGLADVENRIGRSYDRWVAALTGEIVDLWLPRWTTTQGYFLDAALKSLGIIRERQTGAILFIGRVVDPR